MAEEGISTFVVRFPCDLLAFLDADAAKHFRSRNAHLEWLLSEYRKTQDPTYQPAPQPDKD